MLQNAISLFVDRDNRVYIGLAKAHIGQEHPSALLASHRNDAFWQMITLFQMYSEPRATEFAILQFSTKIQLPKAIQGSKMALAMRVVASTALSATTR